MRKGSPTPNCHVLHVKCFVPCDTCHVSYVIYQVPFLFFFPDKVVKKFSGLLSMGLPRLVFTRIPMLWSSCSILYDSQIIRSYKSLVTRGLLAIFCDGCNDWSLALSPLVSIDQIPLSWALGWWSLRWWPHIIKTVNFQWKTFQCTV